ncbi:hypothetical protein [Putridiphycobacter roseus]|nr:hypothetical protein [Putridiphycobacter roseus]
MKLDNRIIFMLATFFVASYSSAQTDSFVKNHSFSMNSGFHYVFDSNPIYQSKKYFPSDEQDIPVASSLNISFEYSQKYSAKSSRGISISGNSYQKYYSISELYVGRILDRNFVEIRGINRHVLLENKKHSLEFSSALTFRFGNESFLAAFGIIGYVAPEIPIYETLPISRTLADLGSAVGLRYRYSLGETFSLHTELNYAFYPITYYNKSYIYSFDRGTSNNLLVFDIGLTYSFGKSKVDIGAELKQNHKKNSFFIQRSIYSFFRSEPIIQKRNEDLGFGPNLSQSFGLGFRRGLNTRSSISIIIDNYEFRNTKTDNELLNGEIKGRTFLGSKVSYLYSLKQFQYSSILVSSGIYYRHGLAYLAGDKSNSDKKNVFSKKELRDLGLSIGLKYDWQILNHVNLFSSLDYTRFVYTRDALNSNFFWDKSPTKNMISFSVGLGLN